MKISPSLLSADFGNLERDINMINNSCASMLHLDVMDGVFVPNISFGFPIIKCVQPLCNKALDVHLMIVEPQKFISQFRDCGTHILTVHQEACPHLNRTIQQIHNAGMKAGVALNPATPIVLLQDIITEVDLVLLMSVNPGFGGQQFITQTLNKLKALQQLISTSGSHAEIEIDGGVNLQTGQLLALAGANILVAGSYIFSADNPTETIQLLSQL